MKVKYGIIGALLLFPICLWAQIAGVWSGSLSVGTTSLTVVLAVEQQGDSLYAELDSPDQYSTGIPVNNIRFFQDSLSFQSNKISASYRGAYNSLTDEVSGEFKQGRSKLPLVFKRIAQRPVILRPQIPQPPFPYTVEDDIQLQFDHPNLGRVPITGTLTYPIHKQDFNNVLMILVSGSGWQDRDEAIMGHKPFAVLADAFTRKGYAVFRYDDLPPAYFTKSSTFDFAEVANFLVYFFTNNENFKAAKVGLVGHSEGGTIAVMVAAENPKVDFVISLAGMMTSAKSTLLYQIRELGKADTTLSDAEVEAPIRITGDLYATIEKAKSKKEAVERCGKLLTGYAATMSKEEKEKIKLTQKDIFGILQNVGSKWFYELFKLNVTKSLKKVKCPMLALNGEKDKQVEWSTNFALMKQYLPKKTNFESIPYPELNHLFQHCDTGLPDEYGKIEETFSEKVLQDMDFWMNEHVVH
ncbi:MAG: alpha/beta hydrolase [Bacteroidales bacterium]|nr:alpha/beta hydrolase [Bacteroidales bacterium]